MLVVIRRLRWRPGRLRRPRGRALRRVFRAWLVTGRLWCRGWLRLVMVALRSPVTRSRRLVMVVHRPAQRQLFLARSLGSRTALLTRSLWWQLMLVVIRRLRWRPSRSRQARRRRALTVASVRLVTLVRVAERCSTLRAARSLRRVRRVVRAVVIWRLRRRVGIRVVVLIQTFSGVAGTAPLKGSAVSRTSPVLGVPRLVLVLLTLPRLWLAALIPVAMIQRRLPELLQPTLRPSMARS